MPILVFIHSFIILQIIHSIIFFYLFTHSFTLLLTIVWQWLKESESISLKSPAGPGKFYAKDILQISIKGFLLSIIIISLVIACVDAAREKVVGEWVGRKDTESYIFGVTMICQPQLTDASINNYFC